MNYSYLTNMNYNAGIYIRLSQEDKDKKYESDSESVTNQKEILSQMDKIIFLFNDSYIVGTYDELLQNEDFLSILGGKR